jgi:hypothetical protein
MPTTCWIEFELNGRYQTYISNGVKTVLGTYAGRNERQHIAGRLRLRKIYSPHVQGSNTSASTLLPEVHATSAHGSICSARELARKITLHVSNCLGQSRSTCCTRMNYTVPPFTRLGIT